MGKIIAYCGLDCSQCNAFLALKNDDQELREKTAEEWSKQHDFKFTPDMIACTSCKGTGVQIGHCSNCEIRKCAMEMNVKNCGACTEFKTCKTINDFIAKVPSVMSNLA